MSGLNSNALMVSVAPLSGRAVSSFDCETISSCGGMTTVGALPADAIKSPDGEARGDGSYFVPVAVQFARLRPQRRLGEHLLERRRGERLRNAGDGARELYSSIKPCCSACARRPATSLGSSSPSVPLSALFDNPNAGSARQREIPWRNSSP